MKMRPTETALFFEQDPGSSWTAQCQPALPEGGEAWLTSAKTSEGLRDDSEQGPGAQAVSGGWRAEALSTDGRVTPMPRRAASNGNPHLPSYTFFIFI